MRKKSEPCPANPSNVVPFENKSISDLIDHVLYCQKARLEIDPSGPIAASLIRIADEGCKRVEARLNEARSRLGFRLHRNAKLEKRDQTNLVVLSQFRAQKSEAV